MKNHLRLIRTVIIAFAGSSVLAGCGAIDPIRDAVLPDFSDEQLGNPMAGFVPSGSATAVPVATSATAPRSGLDFSATRAVNDGGRSVPEPQPLLASTGLLEQAATSGLSSSADAALLDAALDLSPSQMGNQGASMGLVPGSINDLIGFESSGPDLADPTLRALTQTARAPIVPSLDRAGSGFEVLSAAEAALLMADGGGGAIQYTNLERADLQTPYFAGRDNALTGIPPTPGFTAVGTSPAVAVSVADDPPVASFGGGFDETELSRAVLRTNQAAIPIYGGSQRLAQRPTTGTFSPGYAQFDSGQIEFTLTFPTAVAVGQLFNGSGPSVSLTMRNLDTVPVTFQPENLMNRFPPFEIYRWTGSTWASLTLDVAYNLDRQGIAAPIVLQPGQTATRQESLSKLTLLPLTVDLPPTQQMAIRLRVLGQGEAFGNVDSGYLPIRVTDSGAFPSATNLTTGSDAGFVVLDGSQVVAGTIMTQ